MNIRELLIRIGVTGSEQSSNQVKRLDSDVEKLKGSFDMLGGAIVGALSALSLGAILHAADEMQTLEFRTGQVSQSQGTAAEAFDKLAQHATDSRISIEAYTEAYAGIGAATHEYIHTQQDLLDVTDTVSKGLQLAGANTQQTTSVMSQLTQAIAIQKLQWEDLKVIMQNSDAFAVRLAKSMGMSLAEMIKATQGKGGGIGADKIIEALRNMKGEVDETFKQMPMTVSQAMTVVSNEFGIMVNNFNRASGAITWIANNIVGAMHYATSAVDFLTEALGGAENAVRILGAVLGAAGFLGALKAIQFVIAGLFSPIGLLIAGLAALYLVGQDFYTWLKGGPSLLGDLIGPMENYRGELGKTKTALQDMRDIAVALYRTLNKLADLFNEAQTWGGPGTFMGDISELTGAKNVAPASKKFFSWLSDDLGKWADWGNNATFGAFDVPQMWGDMMRGVRGGNNQAQTEGVSAINQTADLQSRYSNLNFDTPSMNAGRTSINVTIGTIDASNSDASGDDVRRAARQGLTDAFNAVPGFQTNFGDSLSFAGGGS